MRLVFIGDYRYNLGPSNVNKQIIRYRSKRLFYVRYDGRIRRYLDTIVKIVFSKGIIVSGVCGLNIFALKFARLLKKKTAYIMHGNAQYESQINRTVPLKWDLKWENTLLEQANLILPVSIKYGNWVKMRYPQYEKKVKPWLLGVDDQRHAAGTKEKGSVLAVGGDTRLKNNLTVSNAVERLQGEATLKVLGSYSEQSIPHQNSHTEWMGTVPHDEFIRQLESTELFVANSLIDSFNISVMEALSCGCSILISDYVGAADHLTLSEHDVIHNPMDEQEVSEKISYLLDHPNNERICSGIDWDNISYEKAVHKLEEICAEMVR